MRKDSYIDFMNKIHENNNKDSRELYQLYKRSHFSDPEEWYQWWWTRMVGKPEPTMTDPVTKEVFPYDVGMSNPRTSQWQAICYSTVALIALVFWSKVHG